jgi:predicted Zn-dependent peptidase
LLRSISGRGGQLSVDAGREIIEVSVAVSQPDLDHALDVLGEVLLKSRFSPDDLERERQVILGQIQEREDEPADHTTDVFYQTVFAGHPLANLPTGTTEGVRALTIQQLRSYWATRLVGPNVIVGVVSGLSDQSVVERLGTALAEIPNGPVPAVNYGDPPPPTASTIEVPGGSDQAHVYIGVLVPGVTTSDRAPLRVMNAILGGRSSGRLFTEIRDRRGLAYSAWSALSQFNDTGAFVVYAATAPRTADQVAALLRSELEKVVETPISRAELQDAIDGEIGYGTLAVETSPSEAQRLTRDTIFGIPPREIQDAELRAVTPADVQRVARQYLQASRMTLVMTRPDGDDEPEPTP